MFFFDGLFFGLRVPAALGETTKIEKRVRRGGEGGARGDAAYYPYK